tara:strand:+ start:238 stop:579 length:342 start_codon:yes stop_codon:yes gene_type:complete
MKCAFCKKKAYKIEHGQPQCFGSWITWGCHYTEEMVEHDRKHYYITDEKYRKMYQAMPLDHKERKKIIKRIEELEQVWNPISRTSHEELLTWHDEKLKTEVRMLEQMRGADGA